MCIARSLIGCCAELEVAQSAATTFQKNHFLLVFHNIADILSGLGIIYDSTARNINIDILAVSAVTLVATAIAAVLVCLIVVGIIEIVKSIF